MSPASSAPKRKLAKRKRQTVFGIKWVPRKRELLRKAPPTVGQGTDSTISTALATAEGNNPHGLSWFEEYALKPADDFFA